MTRELYASLSKNWMISPHLKPVVKILPESGPAEIVEGSIFATPFVVPHDATQTLGYAIEIDGYKFVIMTDIGSMTDEAINYAKEASTVVVEANYDLGMLRRGPYPRPLQDRICGGCGHLSNDECADAIRDFMHEGLRNIFLCHLSAQNNTPELALQTVSKAVEDTGVRLEALPRTQASPLYEL
jgi:phosphoribosyl 1,2-cyclic phosphodiesterase